MTFCTFRNVVVYKIFVPTIHTIHTGIVWGIIMDVLTYEWAYVHVNDSIQDGDLLRPLVRLGYGRCVPYWDLHK